jgi:hypothetical protein
MSETASQRREAGGRSQEGGDGRQEAEGRRRQAQTSMQMQTHDEQVNGWLLLLLVAAAGCCCSFRLAGDDGENKIRAIKVPDATINSSNDNRRVQRGTAPRPVF